MRTEPPWDAWLTAPPPTTCTHRSLCLTSRTSKSVPIIVAMAVDDIVSEPALKLALETSKLTREQAIALLDLVSTHPSTSPADREFQVEVSKQQKLLLTYLAQLRGLHRDAHVGARETKAMTAEARQEVDRLHLQLQNLYYEQRHLQGEITACESYECVESTMIDAERR